MNSPFCALINAVVIMLPCGLKDLGVLIHCHGGSGFCGCVIGEWWQLNPSWNERVSADNFTRKDVAELGMCGLAWCSKICVTLPFFTSGILKPISSLISFRGFIFHAGYSPRKNNN